MRDKRFTFVNKTKQSIYYDFRVGALFFILPDYCLAREATPTLQSIQNNMLSIILNVCERLYFDELVKELVLNRFIIISISFQKKDGKSVTLREAHL